MGYLSRFLCFQDRNFSPVLLYLFLGVAPAEPARNRDRAAGKPRTAGGAPAPPYEARIVPYSGKVKGNMIEKGRAYNRKSVEQSYGIRDREHLQGM